jgi:PP-loop superfamily ATP-utilizing enzyme
MNDMQTVKNGDNIVVWFSCGAASAVAAKKTIEKYGHIANITVVNNPIKEEDKDNFRFLQDVSKWLNCNIQFAINKNFQSFSCVDVWNKKQYMSGNKGAPCTVELKKHARQQWEEINNFQWIVLGFTFDEIKRSENFKLTERSNLLTVLIDEKITKKDCFDIIKNAGIKLPNMYAFGYPNANCIGCVKATSPTYWNHVRKMHPHVFEERAKQSREIGAKLVRVKNKRIFLDLLEINEEGRKLKNMYVECGLFCEEKIIK